MLAALIIDLACYQECSRTISYCPGLSAGQDFPLLKLSPTFPRRNIECNFAVVAECTNQNSPSLEQTATVGGWGGEMTYRSSTPYFGMFWIVSLRAKSKATSSPLLPSFVQACLPASEGGLGEDAGVVYLDTERKVRNPMKPPTALQRLSELFTETSMVWPNGRRFMVDCCGPPLRPWTLACFQGRNGAR